MKHVSDITIEEMITFTVFYMLAKQLKVDIETINPENKIKQGIYLKVYYDKLILDIITPWGTLRCDSWGKKRNMLSMLSTLNLKYDARKKEELLALREFAGMHLPVPQQDTTDFKKMKDELNVIMRMTQKK